MKVGTNYYARPCKICGHSKQVIHIGKSSAGWTFTFHATDEIKSYVQWLWFLQKDGVKIFDEYDKEISLKKFRKMVKEKRDAPHNHAKECNDPYDHSFLDDEENSFSEGEFS